MENKIMKEQSEVMDAFRFVAVIGIVLVHSYTSTRGIISSEEFPIYKNLSYLFSLEFAQSAVPGFLFLSGFYTFMSSKNYKSILTTRVNSILIPYLLWITMILILYYIVSSIPFLTSYTSGFQKPVNQYGFWDFIRAYWDGGSFDGGNGTPILHQFWYLRNLMILLLIYPALKFFVKYAGIIGIVILLAMWMISPGQAFAMQSLAIFTLGGWVAMNKPIFLPWCKENIKSIAVLYVILVVANMLMREHGFYYVALDRFTFLLGVPFWMYASIWMLKWKWLKISSHLMPLSFFIFAVHDPMLTFVKRMLIWLFNAHTDIAYVLVYIFTPVFIVALCIGMYMVLRRLMPKFFNVLVGRRTANRK